MNIQDNDLAKEIITVLAYLDDSYMDKISDEVLSKLNDMAADSTLNVYIDLNKKLSEQDLSDECLDFIAGLYYEDNI